MKTNELTGAALDWAVAKCEGKDISVIGSAVLLWVGKDSNIDYEPSTNWAQGGAIIEREGIDVLKNGAIWTSLKTATAYHWHIRKSGSTPLIATMRCYVTSKLGDEVEIPDEFKHEGVNA